MMINQVALVSLGKVRMRDVAIVAAALQRQVTRDLGPIWNIDATVSPFAKLEDVPLGYWPILIVDRFPKPREMGFHADRMAQPFSLVKSTGFWPVAASHECLEMLVDPFGNRLIPGFRPALPRGDKRENSPVGAMARRVEFLVEVCDPCEGPPYGYWINGVWVSDFCTPEYYGDKSVPGARYDFTGRIEGPRQVLPGGYLSWHDSQKDEWFQFRHFKRQLPQASSLGAAPANISNVRDWIDDNTATPQQQVVAGNGGNYPLADIYTGNGGIYPMIEGDGNGGLYPMIDGDGGLYPMVNGDGNGGHDPERSGEGGPDKMTAKSGSDTKSKVSQRNVASHFRGVVLKMVAEAQAADADALRKELNDQFPGVLKGRRSKKPGKLKKR